MIPSLYSYQGPIDRYCHVSAGLLVQLALGAIAVKGKLRGGTYEKTKSCGLLYYDLYWQQMLVKTRVREVRNNSATLRDVCVCSLILCVLKFLRSTWTYLKKVILRPVATDRKYAVSFKFLCVLG